MILQCKNCNARYLVADSAIGAGGRTVRCAKCSHSWFQEPVIDKNSSNQEAIPDFSEMLDNINATSNAAKADFDSSKLPVPKFEVPFVLKMVVACFVIVVLSLSLLIYKPELVGIEPSKGIVLADIKIAKQIGEESKIFEISGNILNKTTDPKKVPNLRVMLVDGTDYPLQSWEFDSNGKILKPDETMPFSTGALNIKFSLAKRFIVDLGTSTELMLRGKPEPEL
ncbi:MAG: zinc-ribbon domain-containing protein [Rickettsiales bacterium]